MFYETKHRLDDEYFTVEKGESFNFPAHLHPCYEFITVTEGNLCVTVDGNTYDINCGEAVLIFPNQIHSLESKSYNKHILCVFSQRLVKAFDTKVNGFLPKNNLFKIPKYIVEELNISNPESHNNISVKGLLYLIVGNFHSNAIYEARSKTGNDSIVFQILNYIGNHYNEECNLKCLSTEIGYDYAYISKLFKRNVGISYNDYINQCRISEATYLLKNSTSTITEIAQNVGYNNVVTFDRNFKKIMGENAITYRENMKQ